MLDWASLIDETALASVRSAGRVVQTGLHTSPASIDAMIAWVKS